MKKRKYCLAPAYDITPGKTYCGEHMTSVNGKGKDISDEDMLEVAIKNKIDAFVAKDIIKRCRELLR